MTQNAKLCLFVSGSVEITSWARCKPKTGRHNQVTVSHEYFKSESVFEDCVKSVMGK